LPTLTGPIPVRCDWRLVVYGFVGVPWNLWSVHMMNCDGFQRNSTFSAKCPVLVRTAVTVGLMCGPQEFAALEPLSAGQGDPVLLV